MLPARAGPVRHGRRAVLIEHPRDYGDSSRSKSVHLNLEMSGHIMARGEDPAGVGVFPQRTDEAVVRRGETNR